MSFFKSYKILIILIFMSAYNINANTDIKDDLEYLKPKEKHKIGIGGGFIYKPTYVGSSSIRTVWFPTVTYQYNDPNHDWHITLDLNPQYAINLISTDFLVEIPHTPWIGITPGENVAY